MRQLPVLGLLLLLTGLSCKENSTSVSQNPQVPKALQDNSRSILSSDSYSERGYSNLVDKLYAELLEKDAALKGLEVQLQDIEKAQLDSIKAFEGFNTKNESYYESAGKQAAQITDSLLRKQMEMLIAGSVEKYKVGNAAHRQLLEQIKQVNMRIADLHEVLKISRTLPVIEQYQRDTRPSTKSLERLLQMQNAALKEVEALLKK